MKNIKLSIIVLGILFFLPWLSSCSDDRMEGIAHSSSDVLKFGLSIEDFDKADKKITRLSASDKQEQDIKNIAFWVFDDKGKIVLGPKFLEVSGEVKEEYSNDDWAIENAKTILSGVHTLHIYTIANYGSENSQNYQFINQEGETQVFEKEDLAKIKDESLLQKLGIRLSASAQGIKDLTNRPSGYFLRASRQDYRLTGIESLQKGIRAEWVNIHVKRVDARLDFNIKPGENVSLSVKSWRVVNLPDRSSLFEHNTDYPKTQYIGGSTESSVWKTPESYNPDTKAFGFTFYSLENRKEITESVFTPQLYKEITGEDEPEDKQQRFTKWYLLRERKKKQSNSTPFTPQEGKFATTEGGFQFAPENSSYIEFLADVTVENNESFDESHHKITEHKKQVGKDILFRIHMGAVRPIDGGTPRLGDFNIDRNSHYTYHITVTGVDKIKVEVEKNNNPEYGSNNNEIAPGIEGHVTETTNDVLLDSHYDTGAIILNYFSLKHRFYDENTHHWKLNIRWELTSPFQHNGTVDEGWCMFYEDKYDILNKNNGIRRNPVPYELLKNDPELSKRLFDLNQFKDKIRKDLELAMQYESNGELWKAGFDPITGDKIYTVYVNENYYDEFPKKLEQQGKTLPSITYDGFKTHSLQKGEDWKKNAWRCFVNCPERNIKFYIYSPVEFSSDGKSSYNHPDIQISQLSIIAPYNVDELPLDFIGWGYESIDETHNEMENYGSNHTGSANEYSANVMIKHHDVKQYDGRALWLDESINFERFTNHTWWQRTSNDNQGLLIFDDAKRSLNQGELYRYHYRTRYYQYGCIGRNRDLNLDGNIQLNEIRWYMPSLEQVELMCINDRAVSYKYRMARTDGDNVPYATSSSDNGRYHNYIMVNPLYGNTLRRWKVEARDDTPDSYYYGKSWDNQWDGLMLSVKDERKFLNVRACRQLGYATSEDHSERIMKSNSQPFRIFIYNKSWAYNYGDGDFNTRNPWNDKDKKNTIIIDCSYLNDMNRRSTLVANGPLPQHTIDSEYALPYQAFYVASESWKSRYQRNWTLKNAIESNRLNTLPWMLQENNPCREWEENGIKGWRLPNARELQIMERMIPMINSMNYKHKEDGGANGWVKGDSENYTNGLESLQGGYAQMAYILTCTKTLDDAYFYGADFRDYIIGTRIMHEGNHSTDGRADINKVRFDTRCVRDLTQDEIRQLHTTGKINGHKWSDDH